MATNVIKISDKVATVAAEIFHDVAVVPANSDRSLEDEFKGSEKIGDTVRKKIPSRYEAQTGNSRGTANDIKQETKVLNLDQNKFIKLDLTSQELAVFTGTDAKAMKELLLQPVSNLARQTDLYMFDLMAKKGGNRAVLATAANGFTNKDAGKLNAMLNAQLAPGMDTRYIAVGAEDMETAVDSNKELFNAQGEIAKQYSEGVVARGQGFSKWLNSQSLFTITIGTAYSNAGDRITVNTYSYAAGATTLVLKAADSLGNGKTIKAGQAITVAGVYQIDPETLTAIPRLAPIIAQADATFGTDGLCSLTVVGMYAKANNITLANVSALPASAANVTVVENLTGATSGKIARVVTAWNKKAVMFATMDLPTQLAGAEASKWTVDGLTIRYISQYDASTNADSKIVDIQFGGMVIRPEWIATAVGIYA